jgi:RNA polymerase-binding transcription factor DksA
VVPRKLKARANGNEIPDSSGDRADAGSDATQRDFAMSLLSQEHDALTEIDQALKRIQLGTYGVCEGSGKAIPRARLEAIPFARYTVEFQTQLEKERKASKKVQRLPLFLEREIEKNGAVATTAPKRAPILAAGTGVRSRGGTGASRRRSLQNVGGR